MVGSSEGIAWVSVMMKPGFTLFACISTLFALVSSPSTTASNHSSICLCFGFDMLVLSRQYAVWRRGESRHEAGDQSGWSRSTMRVQTS